MSRSISPEVNGTVRRVQVSDELPGRSQGQYHNASPAGGRIGELFQLQRVDVCFGHRTALSKVELRVEPGPTVALIGANGSGKSTLLRLLHGLAVPSAGRIQRNGAMRQAMLFQRPHMLRTSVRNNVALGLWLRGASWRDAKVQAMRALGRVGLDNVAEQNARTLSGGQQQRLALARAWALQPDVLLLDEPTASLDPHAKREVESLMAEFSSEQARGAMTIIFASHNLGQVKRLASRVLYLERGRLLADLPVSEFFNANRLQQVSTAAHLFVKGELE
ncbi:MAG: phosphate ABC transporter ATP-binding protein [Burkholderiaceae bacterium]|nr:MAG: phosphate ABC transporter ATP-binding protein [Burkholderiaceae bacterium]